VALSAAMSFLLRDVASADLDDLQEAAVHLDSVNLPNDRPALERIIARSCESFAGTLPKADRCFVFVARDEAAGRVVGTSMIFAQHGSRRAPHVYFDVIEEERYSESLDRHFAHRLLRIGYNYKGLTEIGGRLGGGAGSGAARIGARRIERARGRLALVVREARVAHRAGAELAHELSRRLIRIFLRDAAGRLCLLLGHAGNRQDADIEGVRRIVAGQQYMTVFKPFKPEAQAAADMAVALGRGQSVAGIARTTVDNSTEKGIPTVLLTPVSVTAGNIKDTLVKDGVFTAGQICTPNLRPACARLGLTG